MDAMQVLTNVCRFVPTITIMDNLQWMIWQNRNFFPDINLGEIQ